MSTFLPNDFLFADRQLERRLVNYFVSQGRPDLCSLRIRAQGGRVRFRGYLDSVSDRDYVLQGARRVAGVIEVKDEILVRRVAATAVTISHAETPALVQPLAAARWIA
jgi:osmotically-inducible protein OsmY